MTVRRIVANIATTEPARAQAFYGNILDMPVVMNHGWIVTHAASGEATAQVSFAAEGGSGTAVPDLSIEVDNFEEVHARLINAGLPIEYGPVTEGWGVRRLFVRDPFGKLVNILSHL